MKTRETRPRDALDRIADDAAEGDARAMSDDEATRTLAEHGLDEGQARAMMKAIVDRELAPSREGTSPKRELGASVVVLRRDRMVRRAGIALAIAAAAIIVLRFAWRGETPRDIALPTVPD